MKPCSLLLLVLAVLSLATFSSTRGASVLRRQRRYLAFPEGSTFNMAFCMSNKARFIADSGIFTEGVAWGCSFDLPNNTRALASAGAGVEPNLLRRKDRVQLYRRVERAVDSTGLDGHACVLRALCETEAILSPRAHLVIELLRIALAMPVGQVTDREPAGHRDYLMARHNALRGADCGAVYPGCPVSLLGLATSLGPSTSWD